MADYCKSILISNEVFREYNAAVGTAQRERMEAADSPALRAALARVEAASAKMQPCVRDASHHPPHRTADGTEWGHPEPEDDDLSDLVDALDAALLAIAEGHADTAPLIDAAANLVTRLRSED